MKKILNPKNLPYAGAIVQAVLFSIAGNNFFHSFGWLAGLGVGAVVNYSIALASSRINDIAEKRKWMARLSLLIMLVLSPATITLSLFMPTSVFTAISWAVCVDLSIVLAGAITGKSLISEGEPKNPAKKHVKPAKAEQEPAISQLQQKLFCKANGCSGNPKTSDGSFKTQSSLNAHQRKHKPVAYSVSLIEPVIAKMLPEIPIASQKAEKK